jgi:anaerobic selenocysteine-containing dehydrogenase
VAGTGAAGTLVGRNLLGARTGTALGEGWVRSTCIICLNRCGILAHVGDDGVVDKILGDPDSPHNHGKTCAKGDSGMEGLNVPDRITTPLRRRNPEKGIGVDPRWEPITWDEALDEIAARMRTIRETDPLRLMLSTFDAFQLRGPHLGSWANAFGAPGFQTWSAQIFCGNNVHGICYLQHNAFEVVPDAVHGKYILMIGSQFGSVVHYDTMHAARELAGKRPDGVRVVSVDPVCSPAASRADEWVPIRPGTDAALILGMVDQLINHLDLYDAPFLKRYTNGPYLVGPDGLYVRDPQTSKPLVWDEVGGGPKPFDAVEPEHVALEGHYDVHGVAARTGFQALKEHVTRYTPEYVEDVTTVPAATVVRLAREFGEAAQIGSTIEIDGVELPYRPASVIWYRGLSAHKHAMLAGMAIILLPTLVGALDVPGGLLGEPYGILGKAPGRQYVCEESPDGMIQRSFIGGGRVGGMYPPRKVRPPELPEMFELLPVGPYGAVFYLLTSEKEDVYKPPPFPQMLIQYHSNMVKSSGPPDVVERFMKRIPFVVSITRRFEETTEFADIVLPDLHHLERLVPFTYQHYGSGDGLLTAYGAKPVVPAPFRGPVEDEPYVDVMQVLLELAKRAGFAGDYYQTFNTIAGLKGGYRLDPDGDYSYIDIVDRHLRNEFGDDHDLAWFLRDGLWTDTKTVQEKYPRPFVKARAHIYFEFMKRAGEDLEQVLEEIKIPWETDDYLTLPEWKPCPSFRNPAPYDLYVTNLKMPNQALSHTHRNALLTTLSARHNDLRSVWINPRTAQARGIADGDRVKIETFEGRYQYAIARVTNLVHPEVVATQGGGGGWGAASNSDEVNFNALLAIDEDHIDFVSGALDSCISVRVDKVSDADIERSKYWKREAGTGSSGGRAAAAAARAGIPGGRR